MIIFTGASLKRNNATNAKLKFFAGVKQKRAITSYALIIWDFRCKLHISLRKTSHVEKFPWPLFLPPLALIKKPHLRTLLYFIQPHLVLIKAIIFCIKTHACVLINQY
jgi:hypothetical protein